MSRYEAGTNESLIVTQSDPVTGLNGSDEPREFRGFRRGDVHLVASDSVPGHGEQSPDLWESGNNVDWNRSIVLLQHINEERIF